MSNLSDYVKGLDDAVWTDARAAKLDNADTAVSSRASQASVDTVDANVDTINSRVDTTVSSRASQASVNTVDANVDTINSRVDTTVSSRASQASVNTVDANVDTINSRVDTTVSSRAPASTALSTATWTNTRAGYLNASISSRAPASTALSSSVWTNTRAGYLDNLAGGVGGGYRPVQSYGYSGNKSNVSSSASFNISVSISSYQNCIVTSAGNLTWATQDGGLITTGLAFRPTSNSNVQALQRNLYSSLRIYYAFVVFRWA